MLSADVSGQMAPGQDLATCAADSDGRKATPVSRMCSSACSTSVRVGSATSRLTHRVLRKRDGAKRVAMSSASRSAPPVSAEMIYEREDMRPVWVSSLSGGRDVRL